MVQTLSSAMADTRAHIVVGRNAPFPAGSLWPALWGNYKSQSQKPRLNIPHTGATVTALSAYTETLGDTECYVIAGGKVITGQVLVWRCCKTLCVLWADL